MNKFENYSLMPLFIEITQIKQEQDYNIYVQFPLIAKRRFVWYESKQLTPTKCFIRLTRVDVTDLQWLHVGFGWPLVPLPRLSTAAAGFWELCDLHRPSSWVCEAEYWGFHTTPGPWPVWCRKCASGLTAWNKNKEKNHPQHFSFHFARMETGNYK